jgi:hypothetical protein|tara:strand:- start:178 stop:759 length:582 start_codon:yes stop_codon:yes gene_type:complete
MHVAGKVFLGLGAVLLLLGIVMAGLGGNALEDVGDVDVEGKSVWSGQEGVFSYDGKDTLMVFVPDTVRCDDFTITFSNESGETQTEMDRCTEDGSAPEGYADDPSGWYHMGTFGWAGESAGDYTLDANAEVNLLPMWEVLGEELGEAAGGIMGILGGVGLSGCGVCFLLLGGILAIALNDPKEATQMQQPPSV